MDALRPEHLKQRAFEQFASVNESVSLPELGSSQTRGEVADCSGTALCNMLFKRCRVKEEEWVDRKMNWRMRV